MTDQQVTAFHDRIDRLDPDMPPRFGKMNAGQMLCHCADFFRVAKGQRSVFVARPIAAQELIRMARAGEPIPTAIGMDQVRGDGTPPTNFARDRQTLKDLISEFAGLPADFTFAAHPYMGEMQRKGWNEMASFHLDHHLKQFNV